MITVINTSRFILACDMTQFTKYERNGVVKLVKTPTTFESKTLSEVLENFGGQTMDDNLLIADFEKMYSQKAASVCFRLVLKVQEYEEFENMCSKHFEPEEWEKAKTVIKIFWKTQKDYLPPICAFIGGVVAQEVVKGMTQKFTPIK